MKLDEIRGALTGRTPLPPQESLPAAVFVPLTAGEDGAVSLLLEVRAHTLRHQPGECCFPGGQLEPGETPLDCALRETREELGPLELAPICPLDPLRHSSGQLIYPWLGEAQRLERLAPSPGEVAEVFSIPLEWLRATPPQWTAYTMAAVEEAEPGHPLAAFLPHYRKTRETPFWVWQEHTIWGMTARVILQLLELLVEIEAAPF